MWWADDALQHDIITVMAQGTFDLAGTNRARWRWQALIMQPEPVDGDIIGQAVAQARAKSVPPLNRLRFFRWEKAGARRSYTSVPTPPKPHPSCGSTRASRPLAIGPEGATRRSTSETLAAAPRKAPDHPAHPIEPC